MTNNSFIISKTKGVDMLNFTCEEKRYDEFDDMDDYEYQQDTYEYDPSEENICYEQDFYDLENIPQEY
jgi:hypothetical protein